MRNIVRWKEFCLLIYGKMSTDTKKWSNLCKMPDNFQAKPKSILSDENILDNDWVGKAMEMKMEIEDEDKDRVCHVLTSRGSGPPDPVHNTRLNKRSPICATRAFSLRFD